MADFVGEPPERKSQEDLSIMAEEMKPKELKLADGNIYQLTPLTLNIMCMAQETFKKPFTVLIKEDEVIAYRFILFSLLKKNHPSLTLEQVGELVTARILNEFQGIIAEQIGG